MEQPLPMSLKQLNKLDVIRRVERHELSQVAAAKMLKVTDRTIRNYLVALDEEGPGFLQHGLREGLQQPDSIEGGGADWGFA